MAGARSRSRFEIALFVAVQACIASFYWNKSLGVSLAGWFELYAQRMNAGQFPYRDFYLFSTPLFPWTISKLFALFGDSLILSYAMGVATRIITATVVYAWLRKLAVRALPALAAVSFGSLLFSADTADPGNYYNHYSVMFMILSAALLREQLPRRAATLASFAAGLLAFAAFLAKQTIGGVWVLVGSTCVAIFSIGPVRTVLGAEGGVRSRLARLARLPLVLYALGVAAGAGLLVGWLASHHAGSAFVDQIFIHGPTAKGSWRQILTRPFLIIDMPMLWQACLFGCVAAAALLSHGWSGLTRARTAEPGWPPGDARSLGAGAIVIVIAAWVGFATGGLSPTRFLNYVALYGGFVVAVVCALVLLYRYLRGNLGGPAEPVPPETLRSDISLTLLAATACSVVAALSLSFPMYEPMAMPTAVVLFAVPLALAARAGDSGKVRVMGRACTAIAVLLVFHTAAFKRFIPFDFAFWCEPPLTTERAISKIPRLRGLSLSSRTVRTVEGVVNAIEKAGAGPNDLFVYPDMALFYYLTDRIPPTYAFVHWWDVAAETVLAQDFERLQQHPPKVMVIRKLREDEKRINNMTNVLSDYIDGVSSQYTMVYRSEPYASEPILVYVRASAADDDKAGPKTAHSGG
jgi:hypothetical protein